MKNLILACVCASLSSLASGQVYKWVDERGVTHYGERPPSAQSATQLRSAPAAAPAPAPEAPRSSAGAAAAPTGNAAAFASCKSRACNSVRRVDPDCRSSYCTEALALPDECTTISCQSRRNELDKRVAKLQQARAPREQTNSRDVVSEQRAAAAAQATSRAVARCKESRGINCDSPGVAAQWAREDRPITEQERNQAINARRQREACRGARGALGCP